MDDYPAASAFQMEYTMKALIVSGGLVADEYRLSKTLEGQQPFDLLLTSDDAGVCSLAAEWGHKAGVRVEQVRLDTTRGKLARRWQVRAIVDRGTELKSSGAHVIVLAFPGTGATLDLMTLARARELFVVEVG